MITKIKGVPLNKISALQVREIGETYAVENVEAVDETTVRMRRPAMKGLYYIDVADVMAVVAVAS